jgi:hypothetical protein
MSAYNWLKNYFDEKLKEFKKYLTIPFIIIFCILIIYSIIGGRLMEISPLMVVNTGIHEFGHSLGLFLTGGNLTSIQINLDYNNYHLNTNTSFAHTNREPGTGILFVCIIGGSLLTIILSLFLVYAPCLRWFAPVIGFGSIIQMMPKNISTDGYRLFSEYGSIVGSITLSVFIISYLYLIFVLTIYLSDTNYYRRLFSRRKKPV